MKMLFCLTLILSTPLALLAQTDPAQVPHTPTAQEKNADVKGTIVPPTPQQQQHVEDAAKKAKRKKVCETQPNSAECRKH